jgi:hypothetical protein
MKGLLDSFGAITLQGRAIITRNKTSVFTKRGGRIFVIGASNNFLRKTVLHGVN